MVNRAIRVSEIDYTFVKGDVIPYFSDVREFLKINDGDWWKYNGSTNYVIITRTVKIQTKVSYYD